MAHLPNSSVVSWFTSTRLLIRWFDCSSLTLADLNATYTRHNILDDCRSRILLASVRSHQKVLFPGVPNLATEITITHITLPAIFSCDISGFRFLLNDAKSEVYIRENSPPHAPKRQRMEFEKTCDPAQPFAHMLHATASI